MGCQFTKVTYNVNDNTQLIVRKNYADKLMANC